MLGPSLGGWLVEMFDWRAVFWFRAPIALFSLVLLFTLPTPSKRHEKPSYDIAGAVTLIVAMSSFMMTLNQLQRLEQQGVLPVIGFAVVFGLSVAGFIRAESKAKEPILKLTVFWNIDFTIVNLTSCLVYLATFAVMLVMPFLLPRLPGLSVS